MEVNLVGINLFNIFPVYSKHFTIFVNSMYILNLHCKIHVNYKQRQVQKPIY